jgi:4-pyridoxate dehydrogenase
VVERDEFDHIIVGAGSAGCAIAARLTEDPFRRVLLLEAGGWDRDPLISIPFCWGQIYTKKLHDWRFQTAPEGVLNNRTIECARGKVVGGCSSTNAMAYVRGNAGDYDRWAESGVDSWSFANVLPYFRKQETWEGGESAYRGGNGPLNTRMSRFQDPLLEGTVEAAREAGFPWTDDYNGTQQEGFCRVQSTIRDGRRCGGSVAYLRPALHRSNLMVKVRAYVLRLVLEGTRAVGIEYEINGQTHIARAPNIILSAGVIKSPHLLMVSGIGDPDALRRVGVAPHVALRGVGLNLRDHLTSIVRHLRRTPGPVHRRMRVDRFCSDMARAFLFGSGMASDVPVGVMGFLKTEASQRMPELQLILNAAPLTARPYLRSRNAYADAFAFRVVLLRPKSSGTVSLRSADPRTPPLIHQNFLAHAEDWALLREGLRLAQDLSSRRAIQAFSAGQVNGPSDYTDGGLDTFIRANSLTTNHPLGTCRMGRPDDPLAVVDQRLAVLGVEGLHVVDASVMPDMIGGNINAAVTMIAERAADILRGRPLLAPSRLPAARRQVLAPMPEKMPAARH